MWKQWRLGDAKPCRLQRKHKRGQVPGWPCGHWSRPDSPHRPQHQLQRPLRGDSQLVCLASALGPESSGPGAPATAYPLPPHRGLPRPPQPRAASGSFYCGLFLILRRLFPTSPEKDMPWVQPHPLLPLHLENDRLQPPLAPDSERASTPQFTCPLP